MKLGVVGVALLWFVVGQHGIGEMRAQEAPPSSQLPKFDVVSIRPNPTKEGAPFSIAFQPGGRFVMTNSPLTALLPRAFPDATTSRIVGAPQWLGTDSYDIVAQASGDPTRSEMEAMLRNMLVERFGLVYRIDVIEADAYDLVPVSGVTSAAGLRRVELDCESLLGEQTTGGQSPGAGPGRSIQNGVPPCRYAAFDGAVLGGGITMVQLAAALNLAAARPVVDKTGLEGRYEVTLRYQPGGLGAGGAAGSGELTSVFTALREQLGLQLRQSKANLRVLVIESIEKPSPN